MDRTANYDQKTTEVNFNYVIKQFNARVMTFYRGHTIQHGETQLLAGRESACRSRCNDCRFNSEEGAEL